MKTNHETIYLVPTDYIGGQLTYSWCDCPAPGQGMEPADAIKYVRADLVPASNEVLANSIAELTRKNSELQAMVSEQSKVIEHIAKAVGEEADPMVCWEVVDALIRKAGSLEQEAKIHASELDTQKSIVRDLCSLFGLRVHDYHCVSKVKEALAARDAEVKAQAVIEFGEDIITHFEGCNYNLTRQTLGWYINEKLRQQAKAGA